MTKVYDGGDVRCPTCNARPGTPCISATGLVTSLPHRTRLNASVAAREEAAR